MPVVPSSAKSMPACGVNIWVHRKDAPFFLPTAPCMAPGASKAVIDHETIPIVEIALIDSGLFELRKQLKQIPKNLEDARIQLDAEQILLDDVQIPWNELEKQIAQEEAEIKVALETIDKFEEHMKHVTTQKEYAAAKKQVEDARKKNNTLQDEILEARMQQEELGPKLDQIRTRHSKVLAIYREKESELNGEIEKIKREVAVAEAKIKKIAGKIGENAYPYYERLVQSGKLPVVVPVISGTCGGCKMTMQPQAFNLLIANPKEFHTCPHCSRIVYYRSTGSIINEAEPAPELSTSA